MLVYTDTSKIMPDEGDNDSQLLLGRYGSGKKVGSTFSGTQMFKLDAEEHYFGSLLITNPKLSTLGTSIIIKNLKKDICTFVTDSCEDVLRSHRGTIP